MFFSLDGIDGTGKSTQVRLLAEWLRRQGRTVTTCADPGGTELGAKLREILLHGRQTSMGLRTECLLFMASRAQLVDEVIAPALARGEIVLADRYLLANVVYQGHAGGLSPAEIWDLGRFATGGVLPDYTVVLDLPIGLAKARRKGQADRVESRDDGYFERVRQGFLMEASRDCETYRVVDASLSIEQVHDAIVAIITSKLAR